MVDERLKIFVTVVDEQHFTKAAEKLLISQPNVSIALKKLEETYGTTLLIRSSKSVKLTPTGERLYVRAKQILALYEQIHTEIDTLHNHVQGKLHIGASFSIGEYLVPNMLHDVYTDFPNLEVEVTIANTEEIVQKVANLDVEFGFIEGKTEHKDVWVQPFMEDELRIAASRHHPLLARATIDIQDLYGQAWVMRERGSGTRNYFDEFLFKHHIQPKSVTTIGSNQGVKEAVMRNLGLSILSKHVIQQDVERGTLVVIPLDAVKMQRMFSFISSKISSTSRNEQAFVHVLNERWGTTIKEW
ncbi:LysR family transcriptional regulator YeiE [Geomicrobium sp. JCM 19037]|uniref:LysR family transcriptional regulator n=1 Tax=unclassified Geomicrobium TaxID=2628951 RepID=UPI00045F3E0F|nr:LysR family transcriptional regulator [Geomicrobium sp. JCM 19037]GAK01921.1 LysR family transcriptional regulator YeiE [Geomicrobium sp. JCM 19037]